MLARLAVSCKLGRAGEVVDVPPHRLRALEEAGIAIRLPPPYEARVIEPQEIKTLVVRGIDSESLVGADEVRELTERLLGDA